MQSYRFIVIGRVQGVYFRKNVQAAAKKENFSGYVKNLPDKSVEACVTCDKSRLKQFLDILQKGSTKSVVENIEQYDCEDIFTGEFKIRY